MDENGKPDEFEMRTDDLDRVRMDQAWHLLRAKAMLPKLPPARYTYFMHTSHRAEVESWQPDPRFPPTDIRFSPLVEEGKAYRVEIARSQIENSNLSHEKIGELLKDSFEDIYRHMFSIGMNQYAYGSGSDWNSFNAYRDLKYLPQRALGEGVLAWGERLSMYGWLDDPVWRWAFQKACFSALLDLLPWRRGATCAS